MSTTIQRRTLDSYIKEARAQLTEPIDMKTFPDLVLQRIPTSEYQSVIKDAVRFRSSGNTSAERADATPRVGVRSRKQELIRDQYWPGFLKTQVATASGYKLMADVTAADLRWIAAERVAAGNALLERGRQFQVLADLMDRTGSKRLADLDDVEAATQALGVAA